MSDPLVSCTMPTYNRRAFVPQAIRYFLRQDYPHAELLVVDDGTDPVADLMPSDPHVRYIRLERKLVLGAKRNLACEESAGEIIVHWDDDDWMAPWRLSCQVSTLLEEQADVCGLDKLLFYEPASGRAWQYTYPREARPWLAGGTLCYTRSFWQRNPFPGVGVGEDNHFVWSQATRKMVALQNPGFYVALIHPGNTSPKTCRGSRWSPWTGDLRRLMGDDSRSYRHLQV